MRVSILVAARNEEVTIKSCLESLICQNVNNNVFVEILVGNDLSEDKTEEIVTEIAHQHSFVKLINISHQSSLKGKINVLDQLSKEAKSDFLLFADADVIYPDHWVENMLKCLESADIVTGVTIIKAGNLWQNFQRLDWMIALKLLQILSVFKIPVTAMGNNMGMKKEMYDNIGGMSNVPFSVAEDFALFREVIKRKGVFKQLFNENVLAETVGVGNINEWLSQRWRWMQGAKKIHFGLKLLNYLNIIFYPLLIILSLFFNELLFTLSLVYIFKLLFLVYQQVSLKVKIEWKATLLFDFMFTFCYLKLLLYSMKKPAIDWKGRLYKSE